MPDDVRSEYEEARGVLPKSPRGAAALLRLAIQKLCGQLYPKDADLNTAIGALVKQGLPVRVQQALDVVRVIGNNAVHAGQIDLKDDAETAQSLFGLVNVITEIMIAQPKEIERLYGGLPEGARAAIERRDGTPQDTPSTPRKAG
jgi:hypothetical protein